MTTPEDAMVESNSGQPQLGASDADVAAVMEAIESAPPAAEPEDIGPEEEPQAPQPTQDELKATPEEEAKPAEEKPAEEKKAEEEKPPDGETPKEEMSNAELFARLAESDRRERELKTMLKQHGGVDVDALRRQAKENPKQFLDQFGIGFEQALDAFTPPQEDAPIVPDDADPVAHQLLGTVKKLEEKLEGFEKREQQAQQQRLINSSLDRINTIVSDEKAGDRWQMINSFKGQRLRSGETPTELIFNTAAYIYHQNGGAQAGAQLPNYEDVADLVEKNLEENFELEMSSYLSSAKAKSIAMKVLGMKGDAPPTPSKEAPTPSTPAELPHQMATPDGNMPQSDEWDEDAAQADAVRMIEEALKANEQAGA